VLTLFILPLFYRLAMGWAMTGKRASL
jgi:hypothetical protein